MGCQPTNDPRLISADANMPDDGQLRPAVSRYEPSCCAITVHWDGRAHIHSLRNASSVVIQDVSSVIVSNASTKTSLNAAPP